MFMLLMLYKVPRTLDFKIIRITSFEALNLIFKCISLNKNVACAPIIAPILDTSLTITIAAILLANHASTTFSILIIIIVSGFNLILIQI